MKIKDLDHASYMTIMAIGGDEWRLSGMVDGEIRHTGETMQLMMLPHRIWSLVLKYNAKRRGDICELAIRGGPYGVSIRYAYHGPRGFVSEYLHNESLQRFLAIRSLIRGELVEVVRHRRTSDRWKEWRLSDARYDTVLEKPCN